MYYNFHKNNALHRQTIESHGWWHLGKSMIIGSLETKSLAHLLPWATAYKESWRQLHSGPHRTGGGPVCSRQPAQTPGGGVAAPGRS